MQRLEVSCAVRPIYGSLGAKVLITILQCLHPGSHDTHPHDNRIRPILYVYVVVSICSTSDPALLENTIEYLSHIPVKMGGAPSSCRM
jgi:hypothetical protein